MKYIGNKTRLLNFISESMDNFGVCKNGIFIDLFAGTNSVAKHFKNKGYKVITNDFMTYSYIFSKVLIELNEMPKFIKLNGLDEALNLLNKEHYLKGYVYENYAPGGKFNRQYFSDKNAMRIDFIREKIQQWLRENIIDENEFLVLLVSLIDAADFVANISGTYGAYLKIWRSMALKDIKLLPPNITNNHLNNKSFQLDSNAFVRELSGDIVYIDPPYNHRQYAPNFHFLESLAVWDKQELKGKGGLRDYKHQKSLYCQKGKAMEVFSDLISNIRSQYIILSYNNEGIISREHILKTLNAIGQVKEYTTHYRRFRTEKNHEKRQYKQCDDKTIEHLFIVKK